MRIYINKRIQEKLLQNKQLWAKDITVCFIFDKISGGKGEMP